MKHKILLPLILTLFTCGLFAQAPQVDKQKIIFVTKGDSLMVDAFTKQGYDVEVKYPGTAGWDYSLLNFTDLVVIGRSMSSGDFKDTESWSKVEAPVLSLSAPAARSSRLKLFNSGEHNDFTFASETDTLWVKIADDRDPMVRGLSLTGDSIDYSTATHSLVKYGADSLEATSSASLIATSLAHDTLGGGRVVACRFQAGVETYPGSGMIPTSLWSYIALSGFSLSDNGLQMIFNEAETLIKRSQEDKKKIIFVSKDDTLFVDALIKEGYDVEVKYPGTEGWDFSLLNFADIVVIGRNMSSGDFKDTENWSKVEVPVLSLSAPAARSSRLKLFNSSEHNDFTFASSTDTLYVKIADDRDPIVQGLMLDADSLIDYSTATHSLVKYGADSLEATSSAKLLATAIAPDTLGGGRVLACRFEAGVETYTGSGMIPTTVWSYIALSGYAVTSNGLQMCVNEIEYLLRSTSNSGKKVILVTKDDSLYMNALLMDGYDVEVMYPGTAGWDFSLLNFADLVVIGRSMSSGDFKDTENWSKVEVPVIILSAPAARSSRLKLLNSGEHNDFTFANETDILYAKIADPSDPIANGLPLDSDMMVDYSKATHSLVKYGADSLEATSSAKLLATAIAPDTLGGGRVLACRFPAGEETYSGSGMIPVSTWTYMAVSGSSSTPNGIQMLLNEAATQTSTNDGRTIIFVTKDDSLFIDALVKEGHEVIKTYPGTEGWSFSSLDFANLVIIGRSSSSGDFKDFENWAKVKPPVLSLAAPVMRSSRLKILNSSEHNDFTFASETDTLWTKIADFADPIAMGLTIDSDSLADYSTATHSLVKYGADSLERTSSAKLLATVVAADTMGNGRVLAARWPAGVETYTGSGMIPANVWSYMAVRAFNLTENGLQMFFNEVNNLAGMYEIPDVVPVQKIVVTAFDTLINSVTVGATLQMVATVLPDDATNTDVIWSVDDPTKATIDSITGVLTGVKSHAFAPVLVIATNSDGFSGTATIFVNDDVTTVPEIDVDKAYLYYSSAVDMLMITNSIHVERVEIFNITGRLMMNVAAYNQESLQISTNTLPKGIYIVRMRQTSIKSQGFKFIK